MNQNKINILIIENNDEKYFFIRNLFTDIENFVFNFDREYSIKAGQERFSKNSFDFCAIEQDFARSLNFEELLKFNVANARMQFWLFSGIDTELINLSISEAGAENYLLKCQFSRDSISNGIHFIEKSHGLRKQLESQIKDYETSEKNFMTMANTNLDGLMILDQNGVVIYSNPAASQVYSYSQEALIGKQLGIPLTKGEKVTLDLIRQDGKSSIVEARFANIKWTNKNAYLVSLRDITEQERLIEALHKASVYDELTNLYNRREANRFIQDEISQCKRYDRYSSILMFDIDNFKNINDSFGHTNGDKALQWIGRIIKNEIRNIDKVARFGGDEFVVLLPSISSESALIPAARICKAVISQPFLVTLAEDNECLLPLSISMGVAEIPRDGETIEEIIRSVDNALYTAKDLGGNCVYLYGTPKTKNKDQKK